MPKITVDRGKCEGKGVCVQVCPESIFFLKQPDKKELSWLARLKLRFHGGLQAFTQNEQNCSLCMACVEACPEQAISVTS